MSSSVIVTVASGLMRFPFRLFNTYETRPEWVADVQRADAIFVAAHVSLS